MRYATLILSALGAGLPAASVATVTGKLGDAAQVLDNPAGAVYSAVLPNRPDTAVRGAVVASSVGSGQGVQFQVSLSGFPSEGGPFLYHIHDMPVPADGNCTGTLAHLDPYERGEDPICDASAPQTCQVGDLSGKHGEITDPMGFSASYQDPYTALVPGIGAFFGNRSIVVHFANKTRITCANFSSIAAGSGGYLYPGTTATGTAPVGPPYGTNNTNYTILPTDPGRYPTYNTTSTIHGGPAMPTSPIPAAAVRDAVMGGAAVVVAVGAALL